ncbi:MAG: endonuclease [Rhodobacter sp.]|nr:endonuclease [Rhodobacter sp.]
MTFVRAVISLGMGLGVLALVLGYLGWLHPAGDSLAVGRGPAAIGLAVLAGLGLLVGLKWLSLGALGVALVVGGPVGLVYVWQGPPGTLTLYQKNMKFRNDDLAGLGADIRAASAMALTLQEVSEPNRVLLDALSDVLPYQLVCPWDGGGGTAVATSLTPVPGGEVCAPGLAAMQVEKDGETLWIVSVHLLWPWPYGQAEQVASLVPLLKGLEGPIVMAGDFNMVRWAWSVRRLAAAARAKPVGATSGTYLGFSPWLNLPIDHAFAPGGGRVEIRDVFGSDHRGLVAQLEL